jgi:hypothetical protein
VKWWERVKSRPVLEVARSLGLVVQPPRGSSGGACGPCPSCAASRRHASRGDRRLTVGVRRDGRGWRCFSCDTSGDALDLVAHRLRGLRYRELRDGARDEVRAWCAREWPDVAALLEAAERGRPAPALPPLPDAPPVNDAPPAYRTAEALAVWERCVAVAHDEEVARYLSAPEAEGGRGIVNARRLAPTVARALPLDVRDAITRHRPDTSLPAATWAETGHRLVLPLFDAGGVMRSVIARAVVPSPRKSSTAGPRSGLVMASSRAVAMLEHGELVGGVERVVIVEGEIDFLTRVSLGEPVAVFGVFAGSWTAAHAARIPAGVDVAIRTDDDPAGAKYADGIVAAFAAAWPGRLVKLAPWFMSTAQDGRQVVELTPEALAAWKAKEAHG